MKQKTLVPAVKRWIYLQTAYNSGKIGEAQFLRRFTQFIKLLVLELNISMFIPAVFKDGKWVVLEEPTEWGFDLDEPDMIPTEEEFNKRLKEWEKAREQVLFEGFKIWKVDNELTSIIHDKFIDDSPVIYVMHCKKSEGNIWYPSVGLKTVEDLCNLDLTLTPTATKKYMI